MSALNQLISVLNTVPGLTITISASYYGVTGNVIYTWANAVCVYPQFGEGIRYWYSSEQFGVSLAYGSFSANVAYEASADSPDTQQHSASISVAGVSVGIDLDPGTITLKTGGTLSYSTGIVYSTAPSNSNYQMLTNNWIYYNIPQNDQNPQWNLSLYLQLTQAYDASATFEYQGDQYSAKLGDLNLGGRVAFSIDSSGNIVTTGALFATFENSFSINFLGQTLVGIELKLLVVGLGVQTQWSSGTFSSALYFGFDFGGKITLLNTPYDYSFIWTYPFHNDISGTSTDTLISQLFDTEFPS